MPRDASAPAASKPSSAALRTSCRLCRARKIKCSAGNPCSFCESRGTLCVYDTKSAFGRPKAVTGTVSPHLLPGIQVGIALELLFLNLFGDESKEQPYAPTSLFASAVRTFLSTQADKLQPTKEDWQQQIPCGPAVYDVMLPVLLQDIIEGSVEQCAGSPLHATPTMYYALSLAKDTTSAMYPATAIDGIDAKPEVSLDSNDDTAWRAIVQRWLDWHPLACIISPLYRSQLFTTAPSLQATPSHIVALVFLVKEESHGVDPSCSETVFSQTQIDQASNVYSAAMNALLLAWNCFCHGKARKGTVYLSLACQLTQLPGARKQTAAWTSEGKLLHSLCQSITVWIYLQIRTKDPITWKLVADQLPTSCSSAVTDSTTIKGTTRKQIWALERAAIVALNLATRQKKDDKTFVDDLSLRAIAGSFEAVQSMALDSEVSEFLFAYCDAITPLMVALDTALRPPGLYGHHLQTRLAYAPKQTSSSEDLHLLCTAAWLHLDFASQLLARAPATRTDAEALRSMAEVLLGHARSSVLQSSAAPHLQPIVDRLVQCQASRATALSLSPGSIGRLASESSDDSHSRVGSSDLLNPSGFSSRATSYGGGSQFEKGIDYIQDVQLPYDLQAISEEHYLPLSFWGPLPEVNTFLHSPP